MPSGLDMPVLGNNGPSRPLDLSRTSIGEAAKPMADKNDGAVIVANTSDSELAINLGSSGTGIPSWMRARTQGLLKSFNSTKLFGFIAGPDDRDVFLHASAVIDGNKPVSKY